MIVKDTSFDWADGGAIVVQNQAEQELGMVPDTSADAEVVNFILNKLEQSQNSIYEEIKTVLEQGGLSPDGGLNNQLSLAVAIISSNATYYIESGVANTYVVSPVSPNIEITSYRNGMEVKFTTANTNTGASTIDVATIGAKDIKRPDGTDLEAGDIKTDSLNILDYDGTNFVLTSFISFDLATTVTPGIVELSTTTEVETGTDTEKAITPEALRGAMTNSKATNGYTKLSNGIIIQWGTNTVSADTTVNVSLPITFPTSFLNANACYNVSATNLGDAVTTLKINTSTIALSNGDNSNRSISWITIGY